MMVGDGSFSDLSSIGAGAFIVSSTDGTEYIIAGGPTPEPHESQNPYRSEIGTILGMGIMASILANITKTTPRVVLACDNDNALEQPFVKKSDLRASQKSIDLISAAHDIWKSSNTIPIPTKVKGRADSLNRYLTFLEQLNVIVDKKAKEYLSFRPRQPIQ